MQRVSWKQYVGREGLHLVGSHGAPLRKAVENRCPGRIRSGTQGVLLVEDTLTPLTLYPISFMFSHFLLLVIHFFIQKTSTEWMPVLYRVQIEENEQVSTGPFCYGSFHQIREMRYCGIASKLNAAVQPSHICLVQLLAAPLSASSLQMCLGNQQRMAHVLGLLYPGGRSRGKSWLLASDC